jgi:hypothetical protein
LVKYIKTHLKLHLHILVQIMYASSSTKKTNIGDLNNSFFWLVEILKKNFFEAASPNDLLHNEHFLSQIMCSLFQFSKPITTVRLRSWMLYCNDYRNDFREIFSRNKSRKCFFYILKTVYLVLIYVFNIFSVLKYLVKILII